MTCKERLIEILTSPIPTHSINPLIHTHLHHPPVTRLTRPIMTSMPSSTHSVANFPFGLAFTDRNNGADDFVPGNSRKGSGVPEGARGEETVGVADTAGVDFDEDFAASRGLQGDGGYGPGGRGVGFVEDHGAIGFGEGWWSGHSGRLGTRARGGKYDGVVVWR